MKTSRYLASSAAIVCLLFDVGQAGAEQFNIPGGDLKTALDSYTKQSGTLLVVSSEAIKGVHTKGVRGDLSSDEALSHILAGTGFIANHHSASAVMIVPETRSEDASIQLAVATTPTVSGASLETVTVTSSKLGGGDVQSIPISITALSQEQLTATQTAGGPDLIKQVPNMSFTKTNFAGYSIQLRGIGTQAISVTTDPAVAVALNDIPFIRNHFFEQEFFDLGQAEVLRGPQGTLYGRNATAGVVNLTTAKPTDQFEAMASGELGNYHQRRLEGMINLPIVDDRLDIRVAGEWTKRQGYSFNELTDQRIDGRDLWSGRATVGFKPYANLQAYLVWEHFQENDDRMRSAKQLCKTDPTKTEFEGLPVGGVGGLTDLAGFLNQGCLPTSLYSPEAFEVPNGFSLPFITGLNYFGLGSGGNPYANQTQSPNLRVIQTTLNPEYKVKNDIVELNVDYRVDPAITITSQTGFNHDFLFSTEDFGRFDTAPGVFAPPPSDQVGHPGYVRITSIVSSSGVFCDPQLGCSDRLVGEDLSTEHAWQLSQEFRLASQFTGPLNFSSGASYLHYETEENYNVFINAITAIAALSAAGDDTPWIPGVTDNHDCLSKNNGLGFAYPDPAKGGGLPGDCIYVDPNPVSQLNDKGHNYFLSENPYVLNSYAAFGEAYYSIDPTLKLIGGLRWTEDRKHFVQIPSWVLGVGYGYPVSGYVDQNWSEFTGRFAANWSPKLDFTDQTLLYASYAHGYKAGGANPPGAVLLQFHPQFDIANPTHPLTFKPEFVDAFELGSKNTLLDGAATINGDIFYYNYKDYQISQIVDRTSVNLNFNATVRGAELEASWEPAPGLKFTFAGGYEDTAVDKGQSAIDLIDRTAGNPNWVLIKPFVTQASNCIIPDYLLVARLTGHVNNEVDTFDICNAAYNLHIDPNTSLPFGQVTVPGYAGFDPAGPNASNDGAGPAPNNGEGFAKDLSGNELPNAPRYTTSVTAEYTLPVSADWAATIHSDFYWQAQSWARIWNDDPYDRLRGYTNVNLALIFTNQNGWQVMLYDKNIFNTTAITGTFLNSDDTDLTTNVFLTDPKLIGVRVTKNW